MITIGQDERGDQDSPEEYAAWLFDRIMRSGELLSADARPAYGGGFRYSPSFYSTDILAGDTQYVFLSLGDPVKGLRKTAGYGFVFDAERLVRELSAVVGLRDLDALYWELAEDLAGSDPDMDDPSQWPGDSAARFQATVPAIQAAHRLSGRAALDWLARGGCAKGNRTELLVPGRLPLSYLVGVLVDGEFQPAARENPGFDTDMGGDWHEGALESPQEIVDHEHFGFWLSPEGDCFVVESVGGHSGTAYGIYTEVLRLKPKPDVDPEQYLDNHGWLRCGEMPGHFGFSTGERTVLTQAQLDVLFDLSLIMPNAATRKFITRLIKEEIERCDEGMQRNPEQSSDVLAARDLVASAASYDDFEKRLVGLLDGRQRELGEAVLRGMNEPGYAARLGTDAPVLLYHGSPLMDLDTQGLRPAKGRRSLGFLGAVKEVENLAVFLTDSRRLAELYAQNRSDRHEYRVYEVYANLDHLLDMTDVRRLPTSLKKLGASAAQAWRGGSKTVRQSEAWWVLDQPEFVAELLRLGYTSAVLFEEARTVRELAQGRKFAVRPRTYAVFSPEHVVVRSPIMDAVRTRDDLRRWYEQTRHAA